MYDKEEEMAAEGKILEDEQHLDTLVMKAERMSNRGYTVLDIEQSLKANRPRGYQVKDWNKLVRSALEYV